MKNVLKKKKKKIFRIEWMKWMKWPLSNGFVRDFQSDAVVVDLGAGRPAHQSRREAQPSDADVVNTPHIPGHTWNPNTNNHYKSSFNSNNNYQ